MDYEVVLRTFGPSDFSSLLQWSHSADGLRRWAGSTFDFPLDEQQLDEYLTTWADNHSTWLFTGVDAKNDQPVGHIGLRNVNRKAGYGRIVNVLVDPSLHKKGIGSQVVHRVLDFGFRELDLHRIDLGVFDTNLGAICFYERLGFKKEGISRDVLRVGDQYWSMCQMSMLRPEWELLIDIGSAGTPARTSNAGA